MANMIMKDGRIVPSAVTILPRIPRNLYPIKMDMLTAKMPGADWEIASRSIKSSCAIHFRLVTISFSINGHHRVSSSDGEGAYFEKDSK